MWLIPRLLLVFLHSNYANQCTPRCTMDKGCGHLAANIGPTMKPFTSTILIIFHPLKDSMLIRTFRMFWLPMPFKVGELWIIMCVNCKSMDKPVMQRQQRGLNWNTPIMPRRLMNWSPKWLFPEKGGRGQPPVNVRRVGERHKIVRQTDSGLGVDARAGPGGPSSPDPPCSSGLFPMTLLWVGSPMLAPGRYTHAGGFFTTEPPGKPMSNLDSIV